MEVHGSSQTSPPLTLPASARHEMLFEEAHPRSGSRRIFSRKSQEMRANPGQQVFSQSTTSCGEDSRRAVNTDDLLQEGLLSRAEDRRTSPTPNALPRPRHRLDTHRGGIGGPRTTYYALSTLRSVLWSVVHRFGSVLRSSLFPSLPPTPTPRLLCLGPTFSSCGRAVDARPLVASLSRPWVYPSFGWRFFKGSS